MQYYWPGLDYLAWILGSGSVVCFLAMMPEPAGKKRGVLKLTACVMLGVGLFCGALGGVLFNARSPRIRAGGTLSNVQIHSGKSSHTDFLLIDANGTIRKLSIDRAVLWLRDGDNVSVVYQDKSGAVLSITNASGQDAQGNDGGFGAWMLLLAAVVLAGYGVLDWFNDGTAIPAEPRDETAALDGDVDSKSMLNLSSRE